MSLENWRYRNPEEVLAIKQHAEKKRVDQCGNCKHHDSIKLRFETIHSCNMDRKHWQGCTFYEKADQ